MLQKYGEIFYGGLFGRGQSDFHRNLGSSPRVRVDSLFNGMLQDKLLGFLNFGLHLSTASVLQVFE